MGKINSKKLFVMSSFLILTVMSCLWIISLSVFASNIIGINPPDQETLQKILSDFETYAEKARQDWGVPGMAISIVQGDEMIYAKGFGVKKVSESDPVDERTIFQIGSTSKAFTAALVSMMVDEGRLHWKDKVIDYLPDFRMYDPWVTREFLINDVMAQHSGMPGYAGDFLSFVGFDREYIIHSIRHVQPISSFRSEFAYMNNLFLVAASLVEKVSEKTWEDNLKERILDPLGMNDTTCTQDGFTQAPNVAYLHENMKGQAKMLPMDWQYHDWVYTYSPAGGINSNVVDMAKWMVLQLNEGIYEGKQLISKENIQYMHSPKTILDANNFYDLAWMTTKYEPYSLIWHNGGTSGIKSVIQIIPEAKLGIVVLTNMSDTSLPEALGKQFVDLYFGKPSRDWSAESLKAYKETLSQEAEIPDIPKEKPLPLEAYTGKYVNPFYGEIAISIEDENLVFVIGPKQSKVILTPWNRDTFLFSIPNFMDEGGFVRFQIDPLGKAYKFLDDTFGEFDRIAD